MRSRFSKRKAPPTLMNDIWRLASSSLTPGTDRSFATSFTVRSSIGSASCVTLPDRSVPNSDRLFVVEYPLAFACLGYFNAFERGVLQISSRRSDTPPEERPADGECVPLLTMSKRISDPGDFVVGNVSKSLGAKLRLQIFIQDPPVIVLGPFLFALQSFFVDIVRRIEGDSVRLRWLFGEKLASFLPSVGE